MEKHIIRLELKDSYSDYGSLYVRTELSLTEARKVIERLRTVCQQIENYSTDDFERLVKEDGRFELIAVDQIEVNF